MMREKMTYGRVSYILYFVGTALVIASWINLVSARIGWMGWVIGMIGWAIPYIVRFRNRSDRR